MVEGFVVMLWAFVMVEALQSLVWLVLIEELIGKQVLVFVILTSELCVSEVCICVFCRFLMVFFLFRAVVVE